MALRNASASLLRQQATSSSSSSSSSAAIAYTSRSFSRSAASSSSVPPRNILHPPGAETHLSLGQYQLNRYDEHYRQTLAPSLLYMTYDPEWSKMNASEKLAVEATSHTKREWDPASPYSKNRPQRPPKGLRSLQPGPMVPDFEDPTKDLVALDRIVISAFCKEAIVSKHALLPLVAQLRAITGVSPKGSFANPAMGQDARGAAQGSAKGSGYIQIIRARSGAASFKLRPGMPVGVQAVLPRPLAMNFLEVLITFVLPRLRTFQGFLLPPASQPPGSPAAMSGVVSLGLGPDAMGNFPQTEINWDAYPNRAMGFQVSQTRP